MIEEVYHLALSTLQNHLAAAECAYAEDDGDLIVNEHRIALSVTFEGFAQQAEQVIAPVEIQIHVDGDLGDRFRVGTLGVGASQPAAIKSAIEEWHLLAADPLLASLGASAATLRRGPASTNIAGWQVFPGRAGVRGSLPPGLEVGGAFFPHLLAAIRKQIADWERPETFTLRSIFIMASASGQLPEVQAAVDGFVDEEFSSDIAALPWPPTKDAYLYKQLFVLK